MNPTVILLEYLSILVLAITIHESIHYVTAKILGFNPKMRISYLGPTIFIPEYARYGDYSEIRDERLRRNYAIIASTPYTLVPIYFLLLKLCSQNIVLKTSFTVIILLHFYSLFYEFKQKNSFYTQIAGFLGLSATLLLIVFKL